MKGYVGITYDPLSQAESPPQTALDCHWDESASVSGTVATVHTQVFERQEQKRKAVVVKTKAARQCGPGGGAQFAHEFADQLLMLLISYRLYLTQEFLMLLFKHQHKSSISRNNSRMRALFEVVLPTYQQDKNQALSRREGASAAQKAHLFHRSVQRGLSRTDFHH